MKKGAACRDSRRRSEDSPMRRGLKYETDARATAQQTAIRRFPDEEGTEMAAHYAHAITMQEPPIRRFPDEEGTEIASSSIRRGSW